MKKDKQRPTWWYDEMDPAGVDYSSVELVQRYDDMHQKLRDYEKNSEIIINRLGLDTYPRGIQHLRLGDGRATGASRV